MTEDVLGILPAFGQPAANSGANGPNRFAMLAMKHVLVLM
jgi:hypothetical protein